MQVTVLDREGKPVVNAVVVVVSAASATASTPGLPKDVVIGQQNMRFVPAISLVAVGARAHFVNNDPWEHHVRASAAGIAQFNDDAAGGFELRIDGKVDGKPAKSADAVFDKPGAVLLGCHLHNSMRGYVYVSDSPWASLTSPEGVASLDVPEGAAIIKVWHPDQLIDIPAQQTTVTAAPAKATMQLSVVCRADGASDPPKAPRNRRGYVLWRLIRAPRPGRACPVPQRRGDDLAVVAPLDFQCFSDVGRCSFSISECSTTRKVRGPAIQTRWAFLFAA